MQKSVDTAQIYKSAVIGKSHYGTFHCVADIDGRPDFCDLLAPFFREISLMREYRLVSLLIYSRHLYRQSLADKFIRFFHISVV